MSNRNAMLPSTAPDPQRLARIAGWFFVGTFVFSIPGVLLYGPLLDHKDYILGGGTDTRIAAGAALEVLTAICNIATAVVLFPIVKRQSEGIALGYVALRIVESTMIAVGLVSVLALVTLRQDLAGASGVDDASLLVHGQSLVAIHDWTFLMGPSFCAGFGNGILLGYLMYKSGLVPRRLAMVGLVGGPMAVLAAAGVLFDLYEQNAVAQVLLTIPEIVWEASLAIYLVRKGFRAEGVASLGLSDPAVA